MIRPIKRRAGLFSLPAKGQDWKEEMGATLAKIWSKAPQHRPATAMEVEKREKLVQAIEKLGLSVSPAAICLETGLGLDEATAGLSQIAVDTSGTLQVSSTGEIQYRFAPGFRNQYFAKGMTKAASDAAKSVLQLVHFLLRISFGTILLLSLFVLAAIILTLVLFPLLCFAAAGMRSRDFNVFTPLVGLCGGMAVMTPLFAWSYESSMPTPACEDAELLKVDDSPKRPFITNCFSFLFGDGEPNPDFDDKKWSLVAHLVDSKSGVVTAFDLAPLTGADPNDSSGVLPALARFQGMPEVTDSGNIIYLFPKLNTGKTTAPPAILEEKRWTLSDVGFDGLWPVWFYASVNISGWWLVYRFLFPFAVAHGFGLFVVVMLGYASGFLIFPAVRWFVNSYLNVLIDVRNLRRFEYAEALAKPSPELKTIEQECNQYRKKRLSSQPDTIVYSTDRDLLEQEIENS
jgi:hypothetical protein